MIRILVAEDFDLLREDLCDVLEQQEDMTVAGSAASGREIVELARTADFDILLMDIEMETTTAGIHATEQILEERPEAKVIFLTAHETDNMILTSMGAGAVDYIVKGCDEAELLLHIRSAYEGHPMLDSKVQNLLLKEYSRLRTSERSLLFFISAVSQLTTAEREPGAPAAGGEKGTGDCRDPLCGGGHRQDPDQEPAAQVRLSAHQGDRRYHTGTQCEPPLLGGCRSRERKIEHELLSDSRPGAGQEREDSGLSPGGFRRGVL